MLSNREPPDPGWWLPVKRFAAASALAIVVAAAPCANSAAITISAERQGDTIDIRASALLQADAETAWRVLTGYDRYTDFIPDLRTSRVVARRGPRVIVEQSGEARVWAFPVPLDITFEIIELPPHSLRSHARSGTLRALESSYVLTPTKAGVRLDYVGHVTPGFGFFGPIELQAVKQNVARQFQALAGEIANQSAAAHALSAAN